MYPADLLLLICTNNVVVKETTIEMYFVDDKAGAQQQPLTECESICEVSSLQLRWLCVLPMLAEDAYKSPFVHHFSE